MGVKITLIGARLSLNLGGPSLLASTKNVLNSCFKDPEYTLVILYKTYKEDRALAPKYGVSVVPFRFKLWTLPMIIIRKLLKIYIGPKDQKDFIRSIEESDIVIDMWGIAYADNFHNNIYNRIVDGIHMWAGKLFGKPVIKYTAALGPFNHFTNRLFARFYFQKNCDLILTRDKTSYDNIKSVGITTPAYTLPDTAFLLESAENELSQELDGLKKSHPLVTVSISYQTLNREKQPGAYIDSMVHIMNHIINKYNAYIILLPNELAKGPNDDYKIGQKILAKMDTPNCSLVNTENLIAQELKAIIKKSDLVVAARYHTIVASLSLGIPTLAIGWHHKYIEVLSLFDQQQWLCNIDELTNKDLTDKFDSLWARRHQVADQINDNVTIIKGKIMKGGELVWQTFKTFSDK
ncbi:polysaccharide pyruvyl transferase family protein [candidate division KSB1 bacterium]|nr:polysaccharide pyruvyl transferase family protein [candidate division KSB1 bacterium]